MPIGAFKKLYEIEGRIRDLDPIANQGLLRTAEDESRYQVRQAESVSIYDELVSWCEAHQPYEPPSTPMAAALRYLLNHQLALRRYLEHGAIPIDNGAVERLHIRVAISRKNYLFAGSDTGAERAAIAYTILGSCALVGVDPGEYLADVLPRLARGIRLCDAPDMLPARWNESRAPADIVPDSTSR